MSNGLGARSPKAARGAVCGVALGEPCLNLKDGLSVRVHLLVSRGRFLARPSPRRGARVLPAAAARVADIKVNLAIVALGSVGHVRFPF
jgi:hypothetical protein